ncbi:MAG: hypothetical protein ABFR62_07880 [Bacteroidota bacterium]
MKKLTGIIVSVILLQTISFSQEKEISLNGEELFGGITARQIGPALMSGRITDIEGHPNDNRIIYAGTAGGGVWKSNDGGATFNSIFDDYVQSIGTVKVDPGQPDKVIWVGTGETWTRNSVSVGNGLYKTEDGGRTWNKYGFENSDRISDIQINPKNSNEVYVGVLGALWGDSDERGVYKTTDGGKTWDKILYVNEKTGCSDLIMDPNNPDILYASFWEFRRTAWSFESGGTNSALYKSVDAGKTWNKIHNGFPGGKLGRIGFALAPSNSNILYSIVESKEGKGLYRSDDGGKNWKHLNDDFELTVRPFYFSRIVIDPKNPDVILKGGLMGSISKDGGKTFKSIGGMHADIHDYWFDINDSDRFYAATDGGFYRTWSKGNTMEIAENIPVSQFYHISVDNAEPYNIYGGLQDNGSWYGPSSSPGGIEARDWNRIGYGDGFRVYRHPEKGIIYSEMQGADNIWRYDIKKDQITQIKPYPAKGDPKLRFNWNAPMALSKNNPDRIYTAAQFLYKSDDMGDTWTKISPDLTTNDKNKQMQEESGGISKDNSGAENHCTIFTIAESGLDENVIWAGTDDGNVQVSKNGGKSWDNVIKNIPDLPANTWCYHIEASHFDKASAYAVFDGHTTNNKNTYVYKTTDYGNTWKSIVTNEIDGFARNIQEDSKNENLLFLGTEFGLYITVNGGENWSKFTNNMPSVAVHHIALQEKTNDIVMGTHGRGIIIIDDISPLREISQDVLSENVHFFTPKPAIMKDKSSFGGGSTETQFVGPNANSQAKFVYYLKKRHTFGKMKMEVQNQNGEKIIDLAPSKQKGINMVYWNYSIKIPKVAKGKTFSFGGMMSPRVEAGKYKLVMTKGKNSYEQDFEVKYDPKSSISAEDRSKQHEVSMKLYDKTQELAYMVYEIDAVLDNYDNYIKEGKLNKDKFSKMLEELTTLKESLVITTGDNYVGSSEPQLREKLGDIYSTITSNYSAPTYTQMQNVDMVLNRYYEAEKDLDKIKEKRIEKYYKYLDKNSLEKPQIKSYDNFLKQS